MRLSAIFLLFSLVVAVSYAAPTEKKEVEEVVKLSSVEVEQTTVAVPAESDDEAVTVVPEEGVTAVPAQRDGRQVDDDDDEDAEDDGEEADEEEDDDEEEEEEEEEEAAVSRKNVKSKNKKVTAEESKPVPVLAEGGLEDDEAEDLGISGGRQEGTSDEKASDEKESDEANDDDKENEDSNEDEEEEEEDDPEDDSNGPTGLVADNEPGSSERGDVEDGPVPQPIADPTQPLAVAVVQENEEGVNAGPVVPVIVDEDPAAAVPIAEASENKEVVAPKETQGKKESKDDDADDDASDEDEEDEEEEEEEEEAAARSEKVSRSEDNSVLFYYPIPQVPEVETAEALL